MPVSKRGFVAIDIDGTALVERIDKHMLFGLSPSAKSHVRQSLIGYILAAQKEGYDIVVLTKRPQLIEAALSVPGGTKSTDEIVDILSQYGIHVKEILRAPSGLKGNKMQQYLKQYDPKDAIGILFDDQLKQVMDVRNKGNPRLMAFDINSAKDLEKYAKKIPLDLKEGESNPYRPRIIIQEILERQHNDYSKQLSQLKKSLDGLDRGQYPTEIDKISAIIDDLCIQLYEAEYRDYLPEVTWVLGAIQSLNTIVERLSSHIPLSHADIARASRIMCNTSKPLAIQPNSACELMIKDLLIYMTRIPLLEDIRHECIKYSSYLKERLDDKSQKLSSTAKYFLEEKLRIVTDLNERLSSSDNPTESLNRFAEKFTTNRLFISDDAGGNKFCRKIQAFLVWIFPFMRSSFQSEDSKFVASINTNTIKLVQEISNQTEDRSTPSAEIEEDPETHHTPGNRI